MPTVLKGFLLGVVGQISCCSFAAEVVRFNAEIRPILAEHCLHCHGPDAEQRQADLRLDLEQDAKRIAILPHQPAESPLLQRIASDDPDQRMPPADTGQQLTAKQIQLLRSWIAQGAEYDAHWSFQPIQLPTVPSPQGVATTVIDRFVVAALESQGLQLSRPIDRQQLIRRATFDLLGLPPRWEDVEAFVADKSPQAFAKVIDRLLDSPSYGERWGRHWLDIARYADTHGGSAIGFTKFPFSYTYRDYVVRSLNADLPYNRFILEQLAADQLKLAENDPALAALGFLTVGMQYRNPHDVIDDQIDVVSRGLLGVTVACARCHDHKFDPIATSDYYSLYATFASSRKPEVLPTVGEPTPSDAYRAYQTELSKRQVDYADMARDQIAIMRGRMRMQVGWYLRELAQGTPEQDLSTELLSFRTDDLRPHLLNRWRAYLAKMPPDDPVFGPWVQLAELSKEHFQEQCEDLLNAWQLDNGDAWQSIDSSALAAALPRWNPRVLAELVKRQPANLIDVAEAYGDLFADVHRHWLDALRRASEEGAAVSEIIPDEDPRHSEINSVVNRQLRRHLYHPGSPTAMPDDLARKLLNRTVKDILNGKRGAIEDHHLSSPGSPARAMVLREEVDAGEFHVFRRGNPIDRGERVEARFLARLSPPHAEPFPVGNKRLALAQRIVDPENPLLRRVVVNWVWQHHFGRGLVRTPDDFGTRGDPPTHPKLLDYLAVQFLEDGWSLKQLHRRIMLSRTYQQAAIENQVARVADPLNRLLWRHPRIRLDMEAMRDAMLAVSGELDVTKMGGRPFDFPSEPVVPRRTLYGFVNRDIVSSFASTFDRADPSACTAKRPVTTVPQQGLFALNSKFIQDRAAALAKLTLSAKSDEQRVRQMVRRAFSREPKQHELIAALQYVDMRTKERDHAMSETGKRHHLAADNLAPAKDRGVDDNPIAQPWRELAHVLLAANEFVFLD